MLLAENRTILKTKDGAELVFNEKSSGLIRAILTDEADQPIQASQLTALLLTLYNRDDATKTIINSVNALTILNDGTRGILGSAKTIIGATQTSPIVVTVTAHGYSSGDLIAITGVQGNRGANGHWLITIVDANTFELIGSSGSGAYTSGGTAVKGLHLTLLSLDNQVVSQTPAEEWHVAYIEGTYASGKKLPYEIEFRVKNLTKVT